MDTLSNVETLQIIDNNKYLSRRRFYTCLIFLIFLFYGAAYNIWGPSWNALVSLFNTDQESMAYGNSLFALGYFTGSFTCAYIFRHFNRQLSITFYLLLMCTTIAFTPLLESLNLFYFIAFLFGMSEGGVDTGANSWLLEMWSEDNHMLMQALYFFFGIGTFLSPLISFSFLSEEKTNDLQDVSLSNNNSISVFESSTFKSDVSTPYFIIAVFLLLIASMNLVTFIFFRYHPQPEALILCLKKTNSINKNLNKNYGTIFSKKDESDVDETSVHEIKTGWNRKMIILVSVGATILCFYDGFENITFEYFASFLIYSPFASSEATAAKIASIMSGSFTIVRGIAIISVKWIKPRTFIILDTLFMFVGVTLVYYNMNSTQTSFGLVFGVILWGAGMATFLPSLYSYLEEHIRMTDSICSVLHLSCAILTPFEPILIGKFLLTLPEILLYVCYASLAITAIALSAFECTKSL